MNVIFSNISKFLTFLLLPWLFIAPCVQGFNYLFQAFVGEGSHFLTAAHLAEVLVHRGHNVTFIISSACSYHQLDPRWGSLFEFVIYDNPHPDNAFKRTFDDYVEFSYREGITQGVLTHLPKLLNSAAVDCDSILSDEPLIKRLKDRNFDLFIFDGGWFCSPMIAEKLNLRTILFYPGGYNSGLAGLLGASAGMSYTSFLVEGISSPPFSFCQRLHNFYSFVYQTIAFTKNVISHYDTIREKHNISQHLRMDEFLEGNIELALMNMDSEIEMPAPLTPNVIPVGGLTAQPAKSLPTELEKFVENTTEGVVVFSLGSYVNVFPRRVQHVIIEAFSLIPYQIVFKFDNKDNISLPSNVKALKWLPQNDLLGHEKIQVLVFQGGNNGFYEAVYHGVPIVILPIMGDQDQVANKAENHGIGVSLNIRTMTSVDLKRAITNVMTNATIRYNIQRARDIYHHRPMNASDRAVYWVEHVTQFGGVAYRPNAFHLNILQYNLLDVSVYLISVLVCFLFLVYKTFLLCCRFV